MPHTPANTNSALIPCLRYRDAPAAIEWLCNTFGLERQLVVQARPTRSRTHS